MAYKKKTNNKKRKTRNKKQKTRKYNGGSAINTYWQYFPRVEKWPDNYGCKGIPKLKILKKGKELDRFGGVYGVYIGRPEDSFWSRSLPQFKEEDKEIYNSYVTKPTNYRQVQLLKNLLVLECEAAPAFGKYGGAIQYIIPFIETKEEYDTIYKNPREEGHNDDTTPSEDVPFSFYQQIRGDGERFMSNDERRPYMEKINPQLNNSYQYRDSHFIRFEYLLGLGGIFKLKENLTKFPPFKDAKS